MHVLIIEDTRDTATDLFSYLESKGHVIDTAGCGISSRYPALAGQFDAIVLDVMLPESDGLGLCCQLWAEGCKATPIPMISACGSPDEENRLPGGGCGRLPRAACESSRVRVTSAGAVPDDFSLRRSHSRFIFDLRSNTKWNSPEKKRFY